MRRDPDPFDLDAALARIPRVRRPRPIVRLWHWRHVPLLGGVVPATLIDLGVTVDPSVPAAIVLTGVASVATTPKLRRWLVGRYRCLVVPHRIRRTFEDGAICSRDGRLPSVVWTSAMPGGVRVRVRCPFGMPARALEEAAELLQAACRADQVTVVREPSSRTVYIGLRFAPRGRWWER